MTAFLNIVKRFIGIICIGAAVYAPIWLIGKRSLSVEREMVKNISNVGNLSFQWGFVIFIAVVVMSGLALFGYYAVKGEYEK
jgi:small-conductance mechanosensitive channel